MTARPAVLAFGTLARGDALPARVVRFGAVGVGNGLVYAGVVAALVHGAGIAPTPASVAGYCASVPLGFVGHRRLSFRSNGRWTAEALRFVLIQAINLAITIVAMHGATAWLRLAWGWGAAATVVLIPIANFLCLNFWVFRRAAAVQATDEP